MRYILPRDSMHPPASKRVDMHDYIAVTLQPTPTPSSTLDNNTINDFLAVATKQEVQHSLRMSKLPVCNFQPWKHVSKHCATSSTTQAPPAKGTTNETTHMKHLAKCGLVLWHHHCFIFNQSCESSLTATQCT